MEPLDIDSIEHISSNHNRNYSIDYQSISWITFGPSNHRTFSD